MKDESLVLEEQLCFVMYACSKEIIRRYKPYLNELDVTYTQYITLLVLWKKDNITMSELGENLHLDSGTLTPLIKRMETNGLVERVRDIKDERNVMVKLKQKAWDLRDKAKKIPKEILDSTGIDKKEADDIRDKLNSILQRVKE